VNDALAGDAVRLEPLEAQADEAVAQIVRRSSGLRKSSSTRGEWWIEITGGQPHGMARRQAMRLVFVGSVASVSGNQ